MANETENGNRRGLGRGLAALIGDAPAPIAGAEAANPARGKSLDGMTMVGLDQLRPGTAQPRRHFDETELEELSKSLKKQGVLQPIVVRPASAGAPDQYEIIAGERRWRAAQKARLHEVPVLVRALSDRDALEIAIVENVQRADLNPIEEAEAFRRLMSEFDYTQEQLAETLGKSRSHIANMLRLEGVTPFIREALIAGKLSTGHARALIGLAEADKIAQEILDQGMSVRQVEKRVASVRKAPTRGATPPRATPDADIRAVEKTLSEATGLVVKLRDTDGKGTVEIGYKTLEQLDTLITKLTR